MDRSLDSELFLHIDAQQNHGSRSRRTTRAQRADKEDDVFCGSTEMLFEQLQRNRLKSLQDDAQCYC